MSTTAQILWTENEQERCLRWQSENHHAVPSKVVCIDDSMNADTAYRLMCEGTALLWRGDFQNARQLMLAVARRLDAPKRSHQRRAKSPPASDASPRAIFFAHRQKQAQRAHILAMLLIEVEANFKINLRRAPDLSLAMQEAYGEQAHGFICSLRELLGLVGAHEWRKNGVYIPALDNKIHPHYGVFSPVRGEYLDLIAQAPLPNTTIAFDIGTGSGVIAALLARRGIQKIIATDQDPRALQCAEENLTRLGYASQVELQKIDMFPEGRAALIVCNPPWLPARPNSAIEYAIYDPESRMLRAFLSQVGAHLSEGGEAWLILSDLAQHLELRSAQELQHWIAAAELEVIDKLDIRPTHAKTKDSKDPLHVARAAETTSLWRLKLRQS